MKQSQLQYSIFISLVASISFGIVDSINIILIEDLFSAEFKSKYFSEVDVALIDDCIAGVISVLMAVGVDQFIVYMGNKNPFSQIIKHPFFDSMGVIFGTLVVIILARYIKKRHFDKIHLEKKLS